MTRVRVRINWVRIRVYVRIIVTITDCRSFSIFYYLTGCRSNSHSVLYYILFKCKLIDAYVFVDVQTRHIIQNNC